MDFRLIVKTLFWKSRIYMTCYYIFNHYIIFTILIFVRLVKHLAPNGRLYIIGMHPIPDKAVGPADIVCEVRRARDAFILLAGHRPYR